MTTKIRQVFEICRLKDAGNSKQAIAMSVGVSVPTVTRYLDNPQVALAPTKRQGVSKLDQFKEDIKMMLQESQDASSVVVRQRIEQRGYQGGQTIVKDYLRSLRGKRRKPRVYLRFESLPGEQFQVDWASFGHIEYGAHRRPLYCFAMVEGFSRMLYLEFTHSMKLEVFLACHINAFAFFGGCCKYLVHDNLRSAVIERDGKLVRFNERYLDFLRRVRLVPRPCNPGAPNEKGKIERSIGYIRGNFFPLRDLKDLEDINRQAWLWRDEVANVRIHQTTGERPAERFKGVTLQPIDGLDGYDSREMLLTDGPQDLRVQFDWNRYSIPFWAAGKPLVVKACRDTVTIYQGKDIVARHERCWGRYQPIINPRHREGLTSHKQRAHISLMQQILVDMGEIAAQYLQCLQRSSLPLKRNILSLVDLKDRFGTCALLKAMQMSMERKVLGAEYVEQILLQLSNPVSEIPRVELKNHPELSSLRLEDIDLVVYDNILIRKGHGNGN